MRGFNLIPCVLALAALAAFGAVCVWVAEFKVWHEKSIALELVKKFGVRLTAYYLNTWKRKAGGLGVPCVVGVRNIHKILRDGELVEIDASHGVVRKLGVS